ncbi:hypothetical protein QYE76_039464 [Lolium multiflorum]|uniref:Peptidase metallopeptidase domain-containing protein n=1 Tax=Lolium multiflorum TaxID=4521 RepID=A0AAD8WTX0_LOLMU|nr:hypothetical protein QYE76_039464 [Lolium multiflorum]
MALMFPCRLGHAAACFLLLVILSCAGPAAATRPAPAHGWHSFKRLQDARRGSRVTGLGELKRYLATFGYMPAGAGAEHSGEPTDAFDEHLEAAVKRYQSRLSLPVTGSLDAATLNQIMSPRCGVEDDHGVSGVVSRFTLLKGKPKWTQRSEPIVLSYAVSPTATVSYLRHDNVSAVFRRAFDRWALVIPVSFVETDDYDAADIKVGFYKGSHGDGGSFDGPLGVLAHALPKNGRLHLDASEQWALSLGDGTATTSESIDLESVAMHEIGHVLGLGHSTSPHVVMYPSIKALQKRADLTVDDVQGVQMLYGPNPNFRLSSLHNPSMAPERTSWVVFSARLLVSAVLVILVTHL